MSNDKKKQTTGLPVIRELPESPVNGVVELPGEVRKVRSLDGQSIVPCRVHPLVEMFPTEKELIEQITAQLVAGKPLVEKIKIASDAARTLLDGKARFAALVRAGRIGEEWRSHPLDTEYFEVVLVSGDEDAVRYILTANVSRRQLTTAQKAELADKVWDYVAALAERRKKEGVKVSLFEKGDTRDVVGKMFDISGRTLDMWRDLTPELKKAVTAPLDGDVRPMTISAAHKKARPDCYPKKEKKPYGKLPDGGESAPTARGVIDGLRELVDASTVAMDAYRERRIKSKEFKAAMDKLAKVISQVTGEFLLASHK